MPRETRAVALRELVLVPVSAVLLCVMLRLSALEMVLSPGSEKNTKSGRTPSHLWRGTSNNKNKHQKEVGGGRRVGPRWRADHSRERPWSARPAPVAPAPHKNETRFTGQCKQQKEVGGRG